MFFECGFAGAAGATFSSPECTDGEADGRVLFCSSAGGGSGGNLKSIGGNGGRRADVRDVSGVFAGLFAADSGRFTLDRSLSAFRFPGDEVIDGFVGGGPRAAVRPASQALSSSNLSSDADTYLFQTCPHRYHSSSVGPADLQNAHGPLRAWGGRTDDSIQTTFRRPLHHPSTESRQTSCVYGPAAAHFAAWAAHWEAGSCATRTRESSTTKWRDGWASSKSGRSGDSG